MQGKPAGKEVSRVVIYVAVAGVVAFGVIAAGAAAAEKPQYKMEYHAVKAVRFVDTAIYRPMGCEVKEWTYAVPVPFQTPRQQVTLKLEPGGADGFTSGAEKLPLLYIRHVFPRLQKEPSIKTTLTCTGTVCSADLVPLKEGEEPPAVTPLTAAERKLYMSHSKDCDYESPGVKAWLEDSLERPWRSPKPD